MKRTPQQGRRGRISPATIIACVALFFSLGGTGLAASHYLITSVRQLAPWVRHELRGARGLTGPQGPAGTQGPEGQSALTPGYSVYVSVGQTSLIEATASDPTPSGGSAAACSQPDSRLLSGGYTSANVTVRDSSPFAQGGIWTVDATLQLGSTSGYVTAWALCEDRTS